jgi:uncharacterized protein (TIGR02246 family)
MPATVTRHTDSETDLAQLTAIPMRMIDAWNRGDARGFAAPFTDDADFIAFEGSHLKGRDAIVGFHQPLFDTVLHGSRLDGEVKLVRILDPDTAIVHAWGSTILPGERAASPSRDSMQLFVAQRSADGWRVEAMQNSRLITVDRQETLDKLDALPPDVTTRVIDLVTTLASTPGRAEDRTAITTPV